MAEHGRHSAQSEDVHGAHARPAEQQPADKSELSRYSRENYGSSGQVSVGARRMSTPKRVAIGAGIAAAVVVVAVLAYVLWFSAALNSVLKPSEETSKLLDEQLVSVSMSEPFYMLVLGSDSREGSGTSSKPAESGDNERSDVMILARIDAPNKQVTLVSVPRDTPYTLEDGTVVKINEAYNIGGAAMSVKAVSELTGEPIAHYAEVRISEMEAIIDAVGGVDVYVDRDMKVKDTLTGDTETLSKGWHTLDGKQAQVFARDRHAYDDAEDGEEAHRQGNVRTLMMAVVKKLLKRPVVEIPGKVLELAQYVTTDLQAQDLVSLAIMFADGDITMYSCSGPSDGDFMEQYNGTWFCYLNPEGWAELMRQVDSGQEPQDIDYAETQVMP